MSAGLQTIDRIAKHYEEFNPGELLLDCGRSSGYLEVSAGQNSRRQAPGSSRGSAY